MQDRQQIHSLITEQQNLHTLNIDKKSTLEILTLINNEDLLVADKIRGLLPQIAIVTDMIVQSLKQGGRLFYFGAGTSGRIGILDASECPPTYGTPPELVQGVIAGGPEAIQNAAEGAEDSEELGREDVNKRGIAAPDIVIGIAASGRTPYVLGALKQAAENGAAVAGIANNANTPMSAITPVVIEAVVGPEVILGSTRMKAGTSQKLILNMLTTASMIKLGKVYGNLMVDLQPSNEKLVLRAKRIIQMATLKSDEEVERAFHQARGHVKTAIVMLLTGTDFNEAKNLLDRTGGFVRDSVEQAVSETKIRSIGEV